MVVQVEEVVLLEEVVVVLEGHLVKRQAGDCGDGYSDSNLVVGDKIPRGRELLDHV